MCASCIGLKPPLAASHQLTGSACVASLLIGAGTVPNRCEIGSLSTTTVSLPDYELTAVAASAGLPSGVTMLLYALIAMLTAALVVLVYSAIANRQGEDDEDDLRTTALSQFHGVSDVKPVRTRAPSQADAGGGLLEVTRDTAVVCPACRSEYSSELQYCPHDARQLVPVGAGSSGRTGSMCPACHRSYEPGTRYCPQDAAQLIPAAVYEVTRRAPPQTETGVVAMVCPNCRSRYDLAATFCSKDGCELMILN